MRLAFLLLSIFATPCLAGPSGVKSVFLNGVDISSARSQELKNVDVIINEQGDIFLLAPHYQVNEEDTYVPLSKYAQGLGPISHKPPKAVRGPAKKDGSQSGRGEEKTKGAKSLKADPAQPKAAPVQDGSENPGANADKGALSEPQSDGATNGNDSDETIQSKEKVDEKPDETSGENPAATP
jgi:hypothetical protein